MEVQASQEVKFHTGVMLLQGGEKGELRSRSATFVGVKAGGVVSYCSAGDQDEL